MKQSIGKGFGNGEEEGKSVPQGNVNFIIIKSETVGVPVGSSHDSANIVTLLAVAVS